MLNQNPFLHLLGKIAYTKNIKNNRRKGNIMKCFARITTLLCLCGICQTGFAMSSEEKMSKEVRKTTAIEKTYKKLI